MYKIKKMFSNKKAQIKIQQTAFMLIFLSIFFVMIALIFTGIFLQSLRSSASVQEKERSVLMSMFMYGASEFSCKDKGYCIDTDKVIFLDSDTYRNLWQAIPYIRIEKLYLNKDFNECDSNTYPDCNEYLFNLKKVDYLDEFGSFVALCRWEKDSEIGVYRKCELGKFMVGVEKK